MVLWVMYKSTLLQAIAFLAAPSVLSAGLIVTYNAPSSQFTTVAGTSNITFDSSALLGMHNSGLTTAGVGTFDNIDVVAPNTYGGSNNTDYAVVGTPSSSLSSTLTFVTPEAYVGLEWLAIDSLNTLTVNFTGGGTATFNSAGLSAALGNCPGGAYCGNPNNRSQDTAENFAYVNLFATGGSTISSLTFSNANYGTGFEFDSISVTSTPQTPFGNSVPEPMSMGLTLSGLAAAGFLGRKKFLKS